MSFRDFDLFKVAQDFGLTLGMSRPLFPDIAPVPISPEVDGYRRSILPLGLASPTDKGRAELVTAPLLSEIWGRSDRRVVPLSGCDWSVDAEVGLDGVSDYLFCLSGLFLFPVSPILMALSHARRDSIPDTVGQCAAEMVAAQRFNAAAGKLIDPIYGCVTTGSAWRFLRLTGAALDIDVEEYSITQPDRILGVLLHCCGVSV